MATFLFVSGAWQGGDCWELLTPLLAEQGHRALTPDLPAMGRDGTPLAQVTRRLWARFVADRVLEQPEPVVLVGHSRGGLVITDAAQLCADRVAGLVYVASLVPTPTLPLRKMFGLLRDHDGPKLMPRLSEDKLSNTGDPAEVRAIQYDRTPAHLADRAIAALKPEPNAALMDDPSFDPTRVADIPRAYIECLHDRSIPLSVQRRMQELLPFQIVESVDSDHSPFYSNPQGLAAALDTVASRLPARL